PRCPASNGRWTPTQPVGRERSAQQARRAINGPLTGVGSGTSRLLTDNRLTRSARASRVNTSLCKQGVGGSSPPAPPAKTTPAGSSKRPLTPVSSHSLPVRGFGACHEDDQAWQPAVVGTYSPAGRTRIAREVGGRDGADGSHT